jgi:hypothetical protein
MSKLLDVYRREWPRVAAVQAMVLGGASLLAGRKSQANLRALAVMNGMTMCAHQYEEYVGPGYFPGMVNVGIFKSDQPYNYPYNPSSAMCANVFFRWLYVPPMLFPQVKWLGLPPALLGIFQGVAHTTVMPKIAKAKYPYSPGALTSTLLHIPIGITYIHAARKQGGISRGDWVKSAGVLAGFLVFGVAVPNLALRNRDNPYRFTDRQMGVYAPNQSDEAAHADAAVDGGTPAV